MKTLSNEKAAPTTARHFRLPPHQTGGQQRLTHTHTKLYIHKTNMESNERMRALHTTGLVYLALRVVTTLPFHSHTQCYKT